MLELNGTPAPTARRTTIHDVAARAQVSATTVSRMLSGRRPVSASTRARIEAVIRDLDFRPNEMARALREQRSFTVALIVRNIANEANSWAARGAAEYLKRRGYTMAIYETNDDPSALSGVLDSAIDRQMDGVIALITDLDARHLEHLRARAVPFVYTGSAPPPQGDTHVLYADDLAGIQQATSHVLASTDGDVAFINGPEGDSNAARRLQGFMAAMRDGGRRIVPALVQTAPWSVVGGAVAMGRLLEQSARIAGVVCANDLIAVGAITTARDARLAVPTDLIVTGFDNIEAAGLVSPALTTVDPFSLRIGEAAAELLVDQLEPETGSPARERVVRPRLIIRESAPGPSR